MTKFNIVDFKVAYGFATVLFIRPKFQNANFDFTTARFYGLIYF